MGYDEIRDGVAPYVLGAVVIFVLLLILHQVLREAVRQGASLKVVYAEQAETNWRCSAAHGPRERDDCIAQRTDVASKDTSRNVFSASVELRAP